MEQITLISAFHHALQLVIIAVTLITLPTLLTGIVISIIQAGTQINEMSMTFIPKLIVMLVVLFLAMPTLMKELVKITQEVMYQLPQYIR